MAWRPRDESTPTAVIVRCKIVRTQSSHARLPTVCAGEGKWYESDRINRRRRPSVETGLAVPDLDSFTPGGLTRPGEVS